MAGGFSDFALNGIIVISPDGTTKLFEQSRFINLVSENKIDIYPQSVIFVPRDVSKVDDLTEICRCTDFCNGNVTYFNFNLNKKISS